jgi:hypothetical protein
MLFGKKASPDQGQIQVAYQQHLPETKKLLIYNMGKSSLKTVHLVIINETEEWFEYPCEPISARSNEVVDFGNTMAVDGKLFTGNILKVTVKVNNSTVVFTPNVNGRFDLIQLI